MKIKLLSVLSIAVLLICGCKKDNYKAPSSIISGRIVYQGQPLGVRSNGVQLELWQHGYANFTKVPVYVAQDGTFSIKIFDGNYKLTRLKGNGPWADNTDSIDIQLHGSTNIDVPVDPFFIVKNVSFAKSGTNITATFNVQQVNTTKTLEAVRIYLGKTLITDQNNNDANAQKAASAIPDLTQPITLSAAIPASLSTKDYLFVRIGVKTTGVAELLYSEPQKVQLK
jgi:Protein of unknown function (DUF3823) N-terminal domain/Domain of unknown function (DUF3823_C)